jgi:acetoin utilization protein AcuB
MTQIPYEAPHTIDTDRTVLLGQEEPLRVHDIMSVAPNTVPPRTPVYAARTFMQQCHIRHLPILDAGRLVGSVSDRDLRLALPSPATSLTAWEMHHLLTKLTLGKVIEFITI